MSGTIDNSPGRSRIESWKEIASFFGRDERTVKRWETSRRLPVHRLPGAKGGVFAYSDELLQWLDSRSTGSPAPSQETQGPPTPAIRARTRHRELLWLAPLLVLLAIVVFASHRLHIMRGASPGTAPRAVSAASHYGGSPASELYLQGRYFWSHRTEGTLRRAVDAFTQAVARDPHFAPAYAGLADSYNLMPEYTGMPEAKAFPIAIEAARRAVSLDDSLAEAHRALGFGLFFWDWDADQAFREYRRAVQLDPTDEDVHSWFAHSLFILGRYADAKTEMERARQLEPTSRSVLATHGLIRYWAGERDAGIAQLQELESSEPDYSAPARYLALIDFHERNYPAYIDQLQRLEALSRNPKDAALASAAASGWKRGGARGMLEGLRTVQLESFRKGESSGYDLAIVCSRLGRRHEADQYLQAAFEARDHHVIRVLNGDLDGEMRGDQRFEQVKRAIRQRVKSTPPSAAS